MNTKMQGSLRPKQQRRRPPTRIGWLCYTIRVHRLPFHALGKDVKSDGTPMEARRINADMGFFFEEYTSPIPKSVAKRRAAWNHAVEQTTVKTTRLFGLSTWDSVLSFPGTPLSPRVPKRLELANEIQLCMSTYSVTKQR